MIRKTFVGDPRPGLIGRSVSGAALLVLTMILALPAANASERDRHDPDRVVSAGGEAGGRSNRQQLSLAVGPSAKSPTAGATTEQVGILFLRSDGGDPKDLRIDDGGNFIFIARRNGEGRAYRNGREVELNPLVKESAGQIAVALFGALVGSGVPPSRLPAAAQNALSQFAGSGITPQILFSHAASRADTGRVSDKMAAKMLAMAASAQPGDQNRTVELVRMAMSMFGLKSDACDNSLDSRCNEPGVREAFAQIKREEAVQHASARF